MFEGWLVVPYALLMGVSGLPSGTVTFLFTDVVGSSGLWESVPSVMATVIARHDSILRGAIDAGGGHVFASGGDGVAAVFGRADEAISAAVAAQQALLAEPWPPEVPLSVRMGVHSGEADERDGDFFGSAVNRAARVMSVAQGGQILVSALSVGVAGPVAGVEFVSVGERRLRGMVEPLELCVVAVDGFVQMPPALEVVRGNLPRPVTEFVGDVGAMQQRVSELSSRRLVTLTGPGGVGKTRTAVEVGGMVGDQFPGGVWLVELAAVTDGELVPAVVLSVLGAQPQPGMSISQSIVEWLNVRATLLILDNAEHLLDAVAALVSEIVAGSASTTVVVTSREPLGVAGEVVRRVPSLPVEAEAVQLFAERATAALDGFVVDDDNRADVVALCGRLDGIPLAIELAAARVRTLSPAEILGRLDDRFRLLRRSGRGGQERHQTLLATVAWSVQLLDDEAACLFRRLSVFGGSFDLAAVEAVCGFDPIDPLDVLDLMASLVDKSMVIAEPARSGGTRYRLLETLSQYGEAANGGHPDAVVLRERHLAHYVAIVESIRAQQQTPREAVAMARMGDEWDNIRVALDWALNAHDDDATDTILFDLALPAFHALRWEFAEWATRVVHDWPERDPERSAMLGGRTSWDLVRGDFDAVVSRVERFGPLRVDCSRREDVAWHLRQAELMLPTVDADLADRLAPWIDAQIADGPSDNADAVMWIISNTLPILALNGRDISLPRSQARQLARRHDFPSLQAIGHVVVDGSVLGFAAFIGDRADDPADYDPVDGLRHASELARSVGAVMIDRVVANWLVNAITDRGFASDALWLRSSLDGMNQDRLTGMIHPMVGQISAWFARIGELKTAAVLVGYTDAHPDTLQWVPGDRVTAAQTLIDDLPERTALARAGASMDLDQLVAYLLDEFDRIASAIAPSGERTSAST